ncbi:unnamed protein product [Fraxinus pennsylvanica]|uniref:Uncharacterized protein n=1 Tax=Fraxinus pennsylvanica TaxID=56036 RepID=A0AAD2EDA5_9LAMI|nr:unnamed protein product [Fraxinus pennsylvanica]
MTTDFSPVIIIFDKVLEIHFSSARFKDQVGDADGACAALLLCDEKIDSSFIESVIKQANMEKHLGSLAAASATYEKCHKLASDQKFAYPSLTVFSLIQAYIYGKKLEKSNFAASEYFTIHLVIWALLDNGF